MAEHVTRASPQRCGLRNQRQSLGAPESRYPVPKQTGGHAHYSRMRIVLFMAVSALIVALAAWYLRPDSAREPAMNDMARSAVPPKSKFAADRATGSPVAPPRPITKPAAAPKSPDYAAQFRSAGDLLSFLEALAPAAAEGDVPALYYLAVASRRCTREYSELFGPPGREKTLDEALEKDFWTKYYEQLARKIYGQCQRFKALAANPFTEWRDLLEAAAEAGSGPAKALLAFEMQNGMIREHDPTARGQTTNEIRALAKEAIRSKDPEAIFHLAFVESITGRTGTPEDVAGAWMLAACQRGLECGSTSEGFQFFCKWDPACLPSETLVDLFRRRPRFDDFQRLANELNAKLDADRFDEIIP
jgi:hypothetical protein